MEFYEEKRKRLVRWFSGEPSPPFKLVLNPTNRCNLNCIFCPNALPRSEVKFNIKDELSNEEWLRIVNDGLEFGVRDWSIIGGGEPLLRYDVVFSMIRTMKNFRKEVKCELITNGTLFRKQDIKELVELGMDRILFSIDGPDAEIHDTLRRVNGTFEKSSNNLKLFSDIKKALGTETPHLKINMVLTNKNYKKISGMVEFVSNYGAQEIALHPMRKYGELNFQIQKVKMNQLEEDDMKGEIIKAKELSKELGVFLNLDMVNIEIGHSDASGDSEKEKKIDSELSNKIMMTHCFEPFYALLIDPNGAVAQCSPAGTGYGWLEEPESGLSIKGKSLRDIWYSDKLNSVRKRMMSKKLLKCCGKCGLTDMRESIRVELLEFLGRLSAI